MAVEEVINNASEIITNVAVEVGKIGLWMQTLGIIVVLWIIFQIISLIINRINRRNFYSIKGDLSRIEKKINKLEKNLVKRK